MARERASGAGAALLADRFGAVDLTDDEVADLQTVLRETGAVSEVESRIHELVASSLESLQRSPLSDEAKQHLTDLAFFVAGRDH